MRPPSPEPLRRRIDLLRIRCLLLHARPRTACRPLPRTRAPSRGRVEEVPGSKASLLALDEQPALASENEERLVIRLGVTDAALAGLEHSHVDPELRKLHRESP